MEPLATAAITSAFYTLNPVSPCSPTKQAAEASPKGRRPLARLTCNLLVLLLGRRC